MKRKVTFQLLDETYTLERKPAEEIEGGGALYNANKNLILINQSYSIEKTMSYVMHELMELATYLTGSAYFKTYPGANCLYVMTHDQLDRVAGTCRSAYEQIRKTLLSKAEQGEL